jgi:hypothetical protein
VFELGINKHPLWITSLLAIQRIVVIWNTHSMGIPHRFSGYFWVILHKEVSDVSYLLVRGSFFRVELHLVGHRPTKGFFNHYTF